MTLYMILNLGIKVFIVYRVKSKEGRVNGIERMYTELRVQITRVRLQSRVKVKSKEYRARSTRSTRVTVQSEEYRVNSTDLEGQS